MTIKKFHSNLLIKIFILYIGITNSYSQSKNENSLYNWFDNKIGEENLEVYNGSLYIDFYRTKKGIHCFWDTDEFKVSNLIYDEQPYYNLKIKYDLYKDNVILESTNSNGKNNICLINNKLKSFVIDNLEFINLSFLNKKLPEFVHGFYQNAFESKNITLYIKHFKTKREVFEDTSIFNEFDYKLNFIIKKDNQFFEINSKSEIVKLFPSLKKFVNDYYFMNSKLEKSNKTAFMEGLFKLIDTNLSQSK